MKNLQVFSLSTIIFVAISCSSHRGVMLPPQCKGECHYAGIAYGSCSTNRLFVMGGNQTNAMLFEARRNMNLAFPLPKNGFYDNLVIDEKSTNYFLFSKYQVTITADIVVSGLLAEKRTYSENYLSSLASGFKISSNNIELSDSVVFINKGLIEKGVVIGLRTNKVKLLLTNNHGFVTEKWVDNHKLFSIDNETLEDLTGLETGQVVSISNNIKNGVSVRTVAGIRAEKVLLEISKNGKISYEIVPISMLQ